MIARRKLPEYVTNAPEDLVTRSSELIEYFVNNYQGFRAENKQLSSEFKDELGELLRFWGFVITHWGDVIKQKSFLGDVFNRRVMKYRKSEIFFEPTWGPFYFGFVLANVNEKDSPVANYDGYYLRRNKINSTGFSFFGNVFCCRSDPKSVYALDSVILKHVLSERPGFTYDDYPTKN